MKERQIRKKKGIRSIARRGETESLEKMHKY